MPRFTVRPVGLLTLALSLTLLGLPAASARLADPHVDAPLLLPSSATLQAARTRVSVEVLPPIAQAGNRPAAPPDGALVIGRFKPARPGAKTQLQKKQGSGWKGVATAAQDRVGYAGFTVKKAGTYRIASSAAVSKPVRAKPRKASFTDAFSGNRLDGRIWRDQVLDYNPNGQRTCAKPGPAHTVKGGTLRLGIKPDPARRGQVCHFSTPKIAHGTNQYLLNSQLTSEGRYEFTHGVAAMRVKFQRYKGSHAGMWLQSLRYMKPGDPSQGVEVDVAEYFGEGGTDAIGSFVHMYDAQSQLQRQGGLMKNSRKLIAKNDRWWKSFHVVSVEWTPTSYVMRLDGKEYWRVNTWISQVPEYLVLSNLSSDYELPNLTKKSLKSVAQVDWVRVWER